MAVRVFACHTSTMIAMIGRGLKKRSLSARAVRFLLNIYPPFLGAGIRVVHLSEDFRTAEVRMRLRFYNQNYFGTHFGGSLYAMTNPLYVLMLSNILGPEYTVWDTAATVEYLKPGRGTVSALFALGDERLAQIRDATASGARLESVYPIEVTDTEGTLVARVAQTLYIRKRPMAAGLNSRSTQTPVATRCATGKPRPRPARPRSMKLHTIAAFAVLMPAAALAAEWRPAADNRLCRDEDDSHRRRYCEVRELTFAPQGSISLDGAKNGGVKVVGGDRSDVHVYAIVGAVADSDDEARQVVAQVQISTGPNIVAQGPPMSGHRHWWTNYKAAVPRRLNVSLRAHNGPLSVSDLTGEIDLETLNGPLNVSDVSGRVRGRTTNGPLNIKLSGTAWSGEGLDLQTTNGPVNLRLPANYNAHVESGTVHGPVASDFPLPAVEGRRHRGRTIALTLGSGGPTIRAVTTNGPVRIDKNE